MLADAQTKITQGVVRQIGFIDARTIFSESTSKQIQWRLGNRSAQEHAL